MSGFVAVPPVVIPPVAFPTLILLLGQLGYEMIRGIKEVRKVAGQVKGGVFRSASGVEVELGISEDGNLHVYVDEAELRAKEGMEETELTDKIIQGYTYEKVKGDLEAKGFTIVEEQELDTGSIRLVVRKWS